MPWRHLDLRPSPTATPTASTAAGFPDLSGNVLDPAKTNYDHAHVLLATASAAAAGIPGADAAFVAAAAAIEQHFWSDTEGCARESWNADFTELEPYRGANSNTHSVHAYLAAGDVSGNPVWRAGPPLSPPA